MPPLVNTGRGQRLALVFQGPIGSLFGRLANDEPIRQGRHRGRSSGPLRDATELELEKCREISRRIIDAAAEKVRSGA
jgi:hypothetical protein